MPMFENADLRFPILLAGPTASGKSALAMTFAKEVSGIIVNADALQVYREWSILTARPSQEDIAKVPHHLYGHISVNAPYSVGAWINDVSEVLQANAGAPSIIVGGTGLYFQALTKGLAKIPEIDPQIRKLLSDRWQAEGLNSLASELADRDPATSINIDCQNPKRVLRALEVLNQTGLGIAAWQSRTPAPTVKFKATNSYIMNTDKTFLNNCIKDRFEVMVEQGALDECKAMMGSWDPGLAGNRAIGAAELIAYLRGESTLERAIELATIATRQYAKRQRTWLRSKMADWTVIPTS